MLAEADERELQRYFCGRRPRLPPGLQPFSRDWCSARAGRMSKEDV